MAGARQCGTDQCHDRDITVVVEAQTESELTFAIQGEKVFHGCINETATPKVVDAKTLKGTHQGWSLHEACP